MRALVVQSIVLAPLLLAPLRPAGSVKPVHPTLSRDATAQIHEPRLAALGGPRLSPHSLVRTRLPSVLPTTDVRVGSMARTEGMFATTLTPTASPASADISQYNPPVADQGDTNACVAWVTAYYMRGWYARRAGTYPAGGPDGTGGFAPMYLYTQITRGRNIPISFDDAFALLATQGVAARDAYTQGDQDYADAPTLGERASAASYKIAGATVLFQGTNQGDAARLAIEQSIAGGDPIGLGIPVYDNFWNADSTHVYIDGTPGTNHGNHTVFATRYDSNGLWIENQWGTSWGRNGWVELSWSFVERQAWEAVTMRLAAVTAGPATAGITDHGATPARAPQRRGGPTYDQAQGDTTLATGQTTTLPRRVGPSQS